MKMSVPNFVIPDNKSNLLEACRSGDYFVRDIIEVRELNECLKEAKVQLKENGYEFIFDNFDTYFSILHHAHADKVSMDILYKSYQDLHFAVVNLNGSLSFLLEEDNNLDEDNKNKILNALKMLLYIYVQIVLQFGESKLRKSKDIFNSKKPTRKKSKSSEEDNDFYINKQTIIVLLNNLMQQKINLLFSPPIVEDTMLKLVAQVGYSFLENPENKADEELQTNIFDLMGTLIKNHGYGMSFVLHIVHLIKLYEHVANCVANGVHYLVEHYNCKSIIHNLVLELTEWQTDKTFQDGLGMRLCAKVIIDLAGLMPDLFLEEIETLQDYLSNDPPCLRVAILGVVAEVLIKTFAKVDLNENEQEARDELFDILIEHMKDSSSIVRSKIIQSWTRMHSEQAIPLDMQQMILEEVVQHLYDKGVLVRKVALNCLTSFLAHNPYGPNLKLKDHMDNLNKDRELMNRIKGDNEQRRMNKLEEVDKKWHQIKYKLHCVVENELKKSAGTENEEDKENEDKNENAADGPMEQNKNVIRMCLDNGQYKDAFKLCRKFVESIINEQRFDAENSPNKVDLYMTIMRSIYMGVSNILAEINNLAAMDDDTLNKLHTLELKIGFLTNCVNFIKIMEMTIDPCIELLETPTISDMHEAIKFFKTAYQFGIENAIDGILAMLGLMKRNEQERKDAVVAVFKTILLYTDHKNMTQHSSTIVSRLIEMLKLIPINNVKDLELIISDWTSKGDLDNSVINILWQNFTKRSEVSDDVVLASTELLRMAAIGRKTIISRNVKIVATVAFSEYGENNMLFFASCCSFLSVFGREKVDITSKNPPERFSPDDEIFKDLIKILVDNFFKPIAYYVKALDTGIDAIYKLCSKPELVCESLAAQIFGKMSGNGETEQKSFVLTRICHLLGSLAVKQLGYMDDTVYRELKRRQNIRDDRSKTKKNDKLNRTKRVSVVCKTANDSLDETGLEGAQAGDSDAEFILNVLENDIVTGSGSLAKFADIIKNICSKPLIFDNVTIQGPAVIALIRYMLVSDKFCQNNLQLLFTILERTAHEDVKCNILVHCSDLLMRFPNTIEPWSDKIFERLKDPSLRVRRSTFFALSGLILRDMIRARSRLSEMVVCLVDDDPELKDMSKTFLTKLSSKENSLFIVLPDIFSHLTQENIELTDENFQIIMKFLFDLIDKNKHMESLVDRFCQKFPESNVIEQQRKIAFCLSLIRYNDKALKKLHENFPSYKNFIHNEKIYGYFKEILENSKKLVTKVDLKQIITDIENSIKSMFEVNDDNGQLPPPIPSYKKTKSKSKKKKPSKRKSFNDDDDDDDFDGESVNLDKEISSSARKKSGRKK